MTTQRDQNPLIQSKDHDPILWWRQDRFVMKDVFEVKTWGGDNRLFHGFAFLKERRIVMIDDGYAFIWELKEMRVIPEETAVEFRVSRRHSSKFPIHGPPGPNQGQTPQWFIDYMEQITNALIMRS